jgi:hypothetical protein
VRDQLPRWAAAYTGRLSVLGRAAAAELVAAGLLTEADETDRWQPTPGIHLWRVRVRHGEPSARAAAGRPATATTEATVPHLLNPTDPAPAAKEDL